jgi:lipopolysaccharide heptosyltransferase I
MPPASVTSRILIVRLGSMGDIVHAMPAVHALRAAHPEAHIDWLVETKWRALVAAVPEVNHLLELDRSSFGEILRCIGKLRSSGYDCVVDFQGLYKSAVISFFSGAPRRIGLTAEVAREGGAALFYSEKVRPTNAHVVQHNLELAARAGAPMATPVFPKLVIPREATAYAEKAIAESGMDRFYVISPGGGWRSKCWPAEQYGRLHRRLAEKHHLRAIVSYGPGEKALAEAVRMVAGDPPPIVLALGIPQLMAVLQRAQFAVGGDSGPLHLAAAMGTPVVGLYGPTDPARNGPLGSRSVIVRNVAETTYKRDHEISPAMRSIRVEQVIAAIEELLGPSP